MLSLMNIEIWIIFLITYPFLFYNISNVFLFNKIYLLILLFYVIILEEQI